MLAGKHIFRGSSVTGALLLAFAAAMLLGPAAAHAATLTVTNVNDSGAGSLRQAITDANSMAGSDDINITATGQIDLASALPDLSTNMTINGPGASNLTVNRSSGGNYRIFNVTGSATVSIVGLTITNGVANKTASPASKGGGIANSGTLTLNDVTLSGNTADDTEASGGSYAIGGGIYNAGAATLTLTDSTVAGNTVSSSTSGGSFGNADGSGIGNHGTMTLVATTVHANAIVANAVSNAQGGGAIGGGGTATITASTIDANTTNATSSGGNVLNFGGGIDQYDVQTASASGNLTLDRVTVTGNSLVGTPGPGKDVVDRGGGMSLRSNGTVTITSSTISANRAQDGHYFGGNINVYGSGTPSPQIENTIVSNPGTNVDCTDENGSITSLGHNIEDDNPVAAGDKCNFLSTGDQVMTDPMLDPLADNGGPTQTMALPSTSPAVDQGNAPAGQVTDQRGYPRPRDFSGIANSGDGADVGAYELQSTRPSTPVLDFGSQQAGTSGSPLTVTLTNESGATITLQSITIGGADPTAFQRVTGTDTCNGATILAGGTCQVSVNFLTPSGGDGAKTATLNIPDTTAGTLSIPLLGTETNPIAGRDNSSLGFGNQLVGTTSSSQSVTLSNTGTTALHINSIGLSGADSGQYALDASDCTGGSHNNVLAATQTCVVHVSFAPTSTGGKSASLGISTDDASHSPLSTSLSGTGTVTPAGPTGQRDAALKKCKKKHSKKARKHCRKKANLLPV